MPRGQRARRRQRRRSSAVALGDREAARTSWEVSSDALAAESIRKAQATSIHGLEVNGLPMKLLGSMSSARLGCRRWSSRSTWRAPGCWKQPGALEP